MAGKNILPVPEIPLKALKSLAVQKIPFVIVGGAAVVLHGIPRGTLDIDIVIPVEEKAVSKLFSLPEELGLYIQDKHLVSFADRPDFLIGQWATLEDKNGIELIDVFFENEKEFKKLLSRADRIKGKSYSFYIASLDDLEKMKKVSGRPIDLADIALIKEKRKSKV